MKDSAMSEDFKRTVLTQECLRRLRTTKQELRVEVQNLHLSEFMSRLKKSGYSPKYRLQILKSAKEAFKKILEADKNGSKPLYRNRNLKKAERQENKLRKKRNWYKNRK